MEVENQVLYRRRLREKTGHAREVVRPAPEESLVTPVEPAVEPVVPEPPTPDVPAVQEESSAPSSVDAPRRKKRVQGNQETDSTTDA